MQMQVNAKKIKQMREQKCWSQLQMSEMAGISLRTLQRVEAKSVASQETIKSIAAVLDLDCELLLPETNEAESLNKNQLNDSLAPNEQSTTPQSDIKDSNLRKKMLWTLLIVILSAIIGFTGVFTAYSENRIDHQQFVFFKDLVAIGFLLGIAGLGYRAYKAGFISLSKFY